MNNSSKLRAMFLRGNRYAQDIIGGYVHFARLGRHEPMLSDREFDRVYHIHCRKTAGTSVNKMFLGLATGADLALADDLYKQLSRPPYNVSCGRWRFTAWSPRGLRHPQFDYGFSHIPLPRLSLPPRTFRFTVLRDPVSRVRSLYAMLAELRDKGSMHPDHLPQIAWVKNGFADFIKRAPLHELAGQLQMFSTALSFDEALERLANIELVVPLPVLQSGMDHIGERFGCELQVEHLRRSGSRYELSSGEHAMLEERLADELNFYRVACTLPNAVPINRVLEPTLSLRRSLGDTKSNA